MAAPSFMETPLVLWVQTFADCDTRVDYDTLADGTYLNDVMHQIDPRASREHINANVEDLKERLHNWDILLKNIRIYYEDCLQQFIVMKLPNVLAISREPHSEQAEEEIRKALLLLLGCAVQCEQKEDFIENIKSLDIEVQHEMVNLIQEITDDRKNVCSMDIGEDMDPEHTKILCNHLKSLLRERDGFVEEIRDLTTNLDIYQSQLEAAQKAAGTMAGGSPMAQEKHHLGVELADAKAKTRRIRQELEEKNELIQELKEELDESKTLLSKLRNENLTLSQDARAARTYRDELDILKEKASRADKHETEILKYKERLNELEFFKARVEELREDNTILMETKQMLEDQLTSSHKRVETVIELENEIMRYKQQLEESTAARDIDRERIQELVEENARLEYEIKSSMNESSNLEHELTKAMKDAGGKGNSLSDQLSETANAKVLRLELENQRLQKLFDENREGSMLESTTRQLELEKENNRLAKKVEKLQTSMSKDSSRVIELEHATEEVFREKDQLQQTIEVIKASAERQVKELETENAQLMQTVETLRERNEKTQDIRFKDIEKENKRLHESVTELRGNLSKMEFDNRQLKKSHDRLQNNMNKVSDLERDTEKLERENSNLQKMITTLKLTCDKYETLEQEASDLEVENRKLSKNVESFKKTVAKVEQLEQENISLTVENQRLHRVIENIKNSSSRVLDLEHDNDQLNKEIQQLKKALENQKIDSMKYDQLEIDLLDVDNDNQKLSKSLELANRKVDELQRDNQELENENQKLGKTLETLKVSLRKLEDMERENTELEQENGALHKEQALLEKDLKKLQQMTEVKDSSIDELSAKLAAVDRENKNNRKSMDKNRDVMTRVRELEKENKDLFQQNVMDKKTLATLREDFVNEKIRSQQLSNELDKLSQDLEKVGLNKEKILMAESTEGESRFKALETMMVGAHQKSLEIKSEKIQSLESRLEESMARNQKLSSELKLAKRKYDSLQQAVEEDGLISPDGSAPNTTILMSPHGDGKPNRVVTQVNLKTAHNNPARDILHIQEHLVEVERTNASLLAENKIMKTQSKAMDERIHKFESQNNNLHSQVSTLQMQCNVLQQENAKLQVETSTLQSQINALQSQNSSLKNQFGHLESDHEHLMSSHEELQGAHESLVSDHEALQSLHEQLTSEYESLISEHGSLKSVHKQLKADYKNLKRTNMEILREKENIGVLREAVEHDRHMIRNEAKSLGSLQSDYINVKDECLRLRDLNDKLNSELKDLLLEHKTVKSEYNNLQLMYTELQGDMAECKDQLNTMDVEVSKMANKVEALQQMNNQLEEENRALMLQLQALLTQNQELLTQTLESKEQAHDDERSYLEKLADLRRQKEKLEEKIMEQYKRYKPSPKKSRSFGANLVRKARGFINRNQRKSQGGTPEHSTGSPDNSSLGSYGDSTDGRRNGHLSKKHRSKSMGQLFSGAPLSAEKRTPPPRKMSQPAVVHSQLQGSKSTNNLSQTEPKLSKNRGLASSTTGIHLLSRDEPDEGGFTLRGVTSSEDITNIDTSSSRASVALSTSSTSTQLKGKQGYDQPKDRRSTSSQKTNSTDSSDLHLPLKKLIPGSMSIYDRTPEDSPRGKTNLMSLKEFLDDLNNSPETRRRNAKERHQKEQKEREEREKAELEASLANITAVSAALSDQSRPADDTSRSSNLSQNSTPERRFSSYTPQKTSPHLSHNDSNERRYTQPANILSQSTVNISKISNESNPNASVNYSQGIDRPMSAMGSPMAYNQHNFSSTPVASTPSYERPRSAMGAAMGRRVMPEPPARPSREGSYPTAPRQRPVSEYRPRSSSDGPSQGAERHSSGIQLVRKPGGSGSSGVSVGRQLPPSPTRQGLTHQGSVDSRIGASPSRTDIPRQNNSDSKLQGENSGYGAYASASLGRKPSGATTNPNYENTYTNSYGTVDRRPSNSTPERVNSNQKNPDSGGYSTQYNERMNDNSYQNDNSVSRMVKNYQDSAHSNSPNKPVAPPRRRGSNPNILEGEVPLIQPTPIRPGNGQHGRPTTPYGQSPQSQQRAVVHPVKPYPATMTRSSGATPGRSKPEAPKNQPPYPDTEPPPRPPPPAEGEPKPKSSVWYEYGCV
ncbi:girdin-like isoform X2 [Lineus longissimus]|uniref:girdin-like isoform X2 n=1 Tax=Lineus longissimus TaxID=88925 RepID=UPI002B4D617B